jgi:hypothetical protein
VSNGSNQLHRNVLIKIFFVLVSEEKVLFPMIDFENLGIEVRSVTHGSSKISWLRRSDLSVVGDCDELSVLYIIFLISGGSFESSNISDGGSLRMCLLLRIIVLRPDASGSRTLNCRWQQLRRLFGRQTCRRATGDMSRSESSLDLER